VTPSHFRRASFFACKRALDVAVSATLLLALSPVLVALAVAVKLTSPGSALFRQHRMGKGSRSFAMFKFRTMVVDAHRSGPLVTAAGDSRVTPIGRFLRATKLDEMPQLWNVLKGDMSLVGPRPQTLRYFEHYREDYSRILAVVRPGITDFAAISYRDEEGLLARYGEASEDAYVRLVIPQKLQLYDLYLERMSLWTDFSILLRTAGVIFAPRKAPDSSAQEGSLSPAQTSPNVSEWV
jgi:lipopolysaccharide/colanic/teichoic acid biosynthesis glycosyltransferase